MYDKYAKLFKALSDPNRIKILELLLNGETCGCTLIEKLPITQPTMSYHLNILTKSGLIMTTKSGVWKKHVVNPEVFDLICSFMHKLNSKAGHCKTC